MYKHRRSKKSNTKIGEMREELTFGIDGAVIKIDNLKFREILGTTVKSSKMGSSI